MGAAEKLTVNEMLGAKALWSEIFYEDSDVFTDYYFQEKMQDNEGYGIKEDGKLVSMLYLTPYSGELRVAESFHRIPLSYIVGVGTKEEYRHRGCMDALLKQALNDLQKRKQPFTFLMPANPEIYTPYQFRYIYDRPEFFLSKRSGADMPLKAAGVCPEAESLRPEEAAQLAAFAQHQLKQQYQFFLHRDAAYYIRQQKESRAQNGDVYVWKENGEIRGFYLYAKEAEVFIQEAVLQKDFAEKAGLRVADAKKPIIMARITDVCAMLSLMRLKKETAFEKIELLLEIRDEIIPANNGTFHWTVGKKESTIAFVENADKKGLYIEIADLTEFLFGRKKDRECFACPDKSAESDAVFAKLSCIEVIANSFVNEIV